MKHSLSIVFILFCLFFITEKNFAYHNSSILKNKLMHHFSAKYDANLIALNAKIVVKQKISCNGSCDGILRVQIISGVAPYSYLWSTGKTTSATNPLCAGTYTVTVTDATGSTITLSKYIGQPAKLLPAYTKTEISSAGASDGTITWTTTGGTSPYSYLWNDGYTSGNRTGISAGTYTITITDAKGCFKSEIVVWSDPSLQNKILYATQMHIHGWSNHNGSPKPGSLQYHNKQADSAGVNVIWWSEHHGIFKPNTLLFSFAGATINPVSLNITNVPHPTDASPNQWLCLAKEGICRATLNNDTLKISLASDTGDSSYKSFTYAPRYKGDLINSVSFSKPLASHPVFKFRLLPTFDIANTRIQIVFRLSWHLRAGLDRQDVITYQIVDSSYAPTSYTNGLDSVTVILPLMNNQWQQVQLNLANDAALLDHGIDNTINDFEIKLLSKKGGSITSQLTDLKIVPLKSKGDSIVVAEKSELSSYNSIYNLHNILGVEFSGSQHLNGFFPDSVNNLNIFTGKTSGNITNWVQNVHQQGGLVSYNHMFGTDWSMDATGLQDYRSDTMAAHIMSIQAYQCDLLEVGYYRRGGSDLNHHLKTWDILTANGLFLRGLGTSDSHGSLWINKDDLFHTFIYSADSSSYELLHALSLGHMFFGNYKYFNSRFYYSLGNLQMGDRGFINQDSVLPVINLDPFPPNCKIKMTQALLNNSIQLTYLHNLTEIDTAALPYIDASQPSFVRFAIYDSLDNALAIGQPIVILGVVARKPYPQQDYDGAIIKAFPNPTDDYLNIEVMFSEPGNYSITMVDAKSNIVKQIDKRYFYLGNYGYRIAVKDLAPATYILSVTNDKKSISQKVIIH